MTRKVIRFHEGEPPPVPRGRGTRSLALALPGLPAPRFTAVDVVELVELVDARDAAGGGPAGPGTGVVVDEVVLRGADRLAALRAGGGERYKMMSFGRRAPGLTRAAFVERWRAEAGRLGGEAIPDDVRGVAYAQDHPVGDDPPFDAVNEAWFDDLDALRRRAAWFAARPVPADLMAPATCGALVLVEAPFS